MNYFKLRRRKVTKIYYYLFAGIDLAKLVIVTLLVGYQI